MNTTISTSESGEGGSVADEMGVNETDRSLSLNRLKKLGEQFRYIDETYGRGLTMEEFRQLMRRVMKKQIGDKKLVENFEKIDAESKGEVDWDGFLSYLLCRYIERERVRQAGIVYPMANTVQHAPNISRYIPLHDSIIQLTYQPTTLKSQHNLFRPTAGDRNGKYISATSEGVVSFWTMKLHHVKTFRIDPPADMSFTVWVIDMVCMHNLNMLAIATTGPSILFYDIAAFGFKHTVTIENLETCATCLDYWVNPKCLNHSILVWGDLFGKIFGLVFSDCPTICVLQPTLTKLGKTYKTRYRFADIVDGKVCGVTAYSLNRVHKNMVLRVRYVPEMSLVMSCCREGETALFMGDLRGERATYFPVARGIFAFDYCRVLQLVIAGGKDTMLRVWNPQKPRSPVMIFQQHQTAILYVIAHHIREQVVSISYDKVVNVFDLNTQQCIQTVVRKWTSLGPRPLSAVFFNTRRDALLVATNQLALFEKGEGDSRMSQLTTADQRMERLLYNQYFDLLLSSDSNGFIYLWDVKCGGMTLRFKATAPTTYHTPQSHRSNCADDTLMVSVMVFDLTQRRLATGATDGAVRTWNFNTGNLLRDIALPTPDIEGCEICQIHWPLHQLIVGSVNGDFKIYLDNNQAGLTTHWEFSQRQTVTAVAFCAPALVAAASLNGNIILWNCDSKSIVGRFNATLSAKKRQALAKKWGAIKDTVHAMGAFDRSRKLLAIANTDEALKHTSHASLHPPGKPKRTTAHSKALISKDGVYNATEELGKRTAVKRSESHDRNILAPSAEECKTAHALHFGMRKQMHKTHPEVDHHSHLHVHGDHAHGEHSNKHHSHGHSDGHHSQGLSDGHHSHGHSDGHHSHAHSNGHRSHGHSDGHGSHSHSDGHHSHAHSDGHNSHGHNDGHHSHGQSDRHYSHGHSDSHHSHGHNDGHHFHAHSDRHHSDGHSDSHDSHGHSDGHHSHGHSDGHHSHAHSDGHHFHGHSDHGHHEHGLSAHHHHHEHGHNEQKHYHEQQHHHSHSHSDTHHKTHEEGASHHHRDTHSQSDDPHRPPDGVHSEEHHHADMTPNIVLNDCDNLSHSVQMVSSMNKLQPYGREGRKITSVGSPHMPGVPYQKSDSSLYSRTDTHSHLEVDNRTSKQSTKAHHAGISYEHLLDKMDTLQPTRSQRDLSVHHEQSCDHLIQPPAGHADASEPVSTHVVEKSVLTDDNDYMMSPQFERMHDENRTVVDQLLFLEARPSARQVATLVAVGRCGWLHFWCVYGGHGMLHGQFSGARDLDEWVGAACTDVRNIYLVTGDSRGYVRVWDIATYCMGRKVKERTQENATEASHADRFYFLTQPQLVKKELRLLHSHHLHDVKVALVGTCRSPPILNVFRAHAQSITSLQYLNGRDFVISGSTDASIRLWSIYGHFLGIYGRDTPWTGIPPAITDDEGAAASQMEVRQQEVNDALQLASEYSIPADIRNVASATTMRVLFRGMRVHWRLAKRLLLIWLPMIGAVKAESPTVQHLMMEREAEIVAGADRRFTMTMTKHRLERQQQKMKEVSILGKTFKSYRKHKQLPILPAITMRKQQCCVYSSLPCHNLEKIDENKKPPQTYMEMIHRKRRRVLKLQWKGAFVPPSARISGRKPGGLMSSWRGVTKPRETTPQSRPPTTR